MKSRWIVASTGFALFSMFFGSGNLVFPITVGQTSEGHYLAASLGILLTGVLVPFLGVLGMMLYEGDLTRFFRMFGSKGLFIFSFLSLALMGPFGVLARCLTVAHGALALLFPELTIPVSSAFLCGVIYLLTINKSRIVSLLGVALTPILLGAIFLIAYFGLSQGEMPSQTALLSWGGFSNGFLLGYQTMDLLAAFFFSQFVIQHLKNRVSSPIQEKSLLRIFCQASFLGAGILSIVYFLLVLLGWKYSALLAGKPPQEMLGLIAMESLGSFALPVLCLTVVFACLTTAIVLASLFSDFLKDQVFQKKIGKHPALITTLVIGFLVSTLDFAGIARFLGPLLEAIYPALITLTLVNIVLKLVKAKRSSET